MKRFVGLIVAALIAGCATGPHRESAEFEAAPSPIDQHMDTASIEDYILALPPYGFHEESVAQFADRVRNARTAEKQNEGRGDEFLFVPGDGSWPSKEFALDRRHRMLTIRILNWEPGLTDEVVMVRRVPGGWMHTPRTETKRQNKPLVASGDNAVL